MNADAHDWFFDAVEQTALADLPSSSVTLVERAARHGAMAPLYRRDEDEVYRVAEGEVAFIVGDETVHAGPDDVVVAPAGVPRTFRVTSETARWLVLTRVDSLQRFEEFGRAVARPMPDCWWPSPEEFASLLAIADANGIEILAPPGHVATLD